MGPAPNGSPLTFYFCRDATVVAEPIAFRGLVTVAIVSIDVDLMDRIP